MAVLARWALVGIALIHGALAGFSSTATNNVAIYWGQNSANQAGSQQRLATYCSNTKLNIIPLAFLYVIKNPTLINFANAGDNCTVFSGSQLLSCPQIEADIKTCQSQGKTILLSIGGATYTEGGFTSSTEATTWANTLWAMFGPPPPSSSTNGINRPFGTAVIDGFDIDVEATSQNLVPFANQLRTNMDAATTQGKTYILSVAPQCPYPDAANNAMLSAVRFDFVSVQFYNNYCGVSSYVPGSAAQSNFNFGTWDTWAKTVSKNPNVKILLGIPGSASAGGGYVSGAQLAAVVAFSRGFESFGGVMVWDMSQAFANAGFLDSVAAALAGSGPVVTPTATAKPASSATTVKPGTTLASSVRSGTPTATTTGPVPSVTLVPQWGQCGGIGYTGSTQCQPPYTCVYLSEWWSHCD
ncbi:glycoside hydrolase superfamily [Podospora appendiculata]|uniref:chitinase n=1 Tax=Podospora appendiculata TaxID=314037 RepID=A0AAE0WYC2_9PEZI|nr:glycoside hydrolase superfamily [Podospora appendiculata]KAK3687586.1 glycoside hydrolase superfamily [Podospora appendiculata]